MENRYNNGRIYKLVCGDLNYIGSTCQPLCKRLAKHRIDYNLHKNDKTKKYMSSFKLFDLGNPNIILIESCKCNNKEELLRRERHHIENSNCVNMKCPTRTYEEYYEKEKENIDKRLKTIYECECGCKIQKRNKSHHERTKFHENFMKAKSNTVTTPNDS
jgi:hypothetical protein